jgi:hypothetical protein
MWLVFSLPAVVPRSRTVCGGRVGGFLGITVDASMTDGKGGVSATVVDAGGQPI